MLTYRDQWEVGISRRKWTWCLGLIGGELGERQRGGSLGNWLRRQPSLSHFLQVLME